jgi:tetratricopeptide (TPR) repeat protein
MPANANEPGPLPSASGNPGQILLREAAEKAKTAAQDADLSEVIAIAEEGLKEKPGQEAAAYGRKLLSWAYNKRGQHYAENQIHEAAIEDYTKALQYDPAMWRAIHNRGVSYASTERAREALADFNRALELNKGYANTWYNRAELYYEVGAFDKAWRDFNEAVRINPQDAAFIAGRGKSAARLGKTREALADLEQALKADRNNASLRLARADLHLFTKNYAAAVDDYQTAIKLDPQLGPAYRGLAWIMATCPDQRYRNAETAVSTAQRAMELDGDSDPRSVETLAAAFANSGQFDAAAELIKHGLGKATGDAARRMQAQYAVYKEGKPWRDGPLVGDQANKAGTGIKR